MQRALDFLQAHNEVALATVCISNGFVGERFSK